MRKLTSLIALLLTLAMLFSLTACKPSADPGSDSVPPSDSGSESTPPEEVKTSPYVIILPQGTSEALYSAAVMLQGAIKARFGYELEIKDDYLSWADTAGEYEILLGDVKRDPSQAVTGLKYNDYSISTSGKKWILKGGCDASTAAAITYFSTNCLALFEECPADYRYYNEATYTVKKMTLCGKDVSDYIMIYPNNDASCETYASRLQTKIASLCGTIIPIYKASAAPKNKAIITFGKMTESLCSFDPLGYDSHEIAAEEGVISFAGGCANAYYTAMEKFEKQLTPTATVTITESAIETRFDQVSRSEYINNPDLFIPIWRRTYTAGTIQTLEQKITALSTPKINTFLTMAHRGEHNFYPENSVEALISAYHAGITIMEMDSYYTRDRVLIVMHDATLTRTTNYETMRGRTVDGITLPTSNKIADWSYEELMKLNLKHGSTVTTFKIATLEEMLIAAKGRMLITVENKLLDDEFMEDVYTLMKRTNNYRSFLIGTSYGTSMTKEECVEWQTRIYQETGVSPVIMMRAGVQAFKTASDFLKQNAVGEYTILLGAYKLKDKASLKVALKNVANDINVGGWTLGGESDAPATEQYWQEMYDLGFRFIMVNEVFDLLKFVKNLK